MPLDLCYASAWQPNEPAIWFTWIVRQLKWVSFTPFQCVASGTNLQWTWPTGYDNISGCWKHSRFSVSWPQLTMITCLLSEILLKKITTKDNDRSTSLAGGWVTSCTKSFSICLVGTPAYISTTKHHMSDWLSSALMSHSTLNRSFRGCSS